MSDVLRFVHISDTHINPDENYIKDYAQYTPIIGARALVDAVNALPFTPDFILHTGDVAYDPDPSVYDAVAEVMRGFNAPVYYLAGNHDHPRALQRWLMGREGDDLPAYVFYEFETKGVQIACLDSNGPHDPNTPSGFVPEEQLEWLDGICSSDNEQPLVIAVHHNVIPMGVPWLDNWMRIENGEDFHRILTRAAHRIRGVFFGHIHQNIDVYRDGILYSAAASSWCQFMAYPMPENDRVIPDPTTPPGFSVVTVSEDRTFIRRHTFTTNANHG